MTEWKTIKVPEEAKREADDAKPGPATWADCLVAGAKELSGEPHVTATAEVKPFVDEERLEEIRQQLEELDPTQPVSEQLDRVEASVETIETRTGRIERQLEELQG